MCEGLLLSPDLCYIIVDELLKCSGYYKLFF